MGEVIRIGSEEDEIAVELAIYNAAKARFERESGGFGSWADLGRLEKLALLRTEYAKRAADKKARAK
jgi:hypothetical protein